MSLERLWLQAWIDGLQRRDPAPRVRPVSEPSPYVPLADTPARTYVRLRPAEGDRA